MKGHEFNFIGGEHLTFMAASWFVSYLYFLEKDKEHKNWQKVKTHPQRITRFNRTKKYHKYWLMEIINMNDKKLATTTIGLTAKETKRMAEELLDKKVAEEQKE